MPGCLQPLIIDFILNGKLARRLEILEFIRISLRGTLAQQFSLPSLQCYLFFFLCHVICKGLVLGEQYAIKPVVCAAVCRRREEDLSKGLKYVAKCFKAANVSSPKPLFEMCSAHSVLFNLAFRTAAFIK